MMKVLTLIVLGFCIKQSVTESCSDFKTCGACIGFPKDTCVWCSGEVEQRCQPKSFLSRNESKNWCKDIVNPKTIVPNVIRDVDFSSANDTTSAVQFRPQQMILKMRPGHEVKFSMMFKHADDFPLDVYYLMDYSYTMNKHVKELKRQSTLIKKQLTEFTNNVWFGLGSFVEKTSYPFVSEYPISEISKSFKMNWTFCELENKLQFPKCPIHFETILDVLRPNTIGKHDLASKHKPNIRFMWPVTIIPGLFDRVLSEERDFGNYDLPEAGLDALMQVMACDKKLGWRANANRIIVLCTDAAYHSAGDGKAVLAYKPNDMECHLNASDYYDYSLKQDYPSVGQINKMARDGKFKIIFATLSEAEMTYKQLQPQIYEAKVVVLNKNIFEIIKDVYLESIRHVTMQYQFPDFIQLKLDPDCTRSVEACRVGHKEMFKMNAVLKVTSCPSDVSKYHHLLEIGPVDGGLEDKLRIDLEIVNCTCECEKDNTGIPKSPKCNSFGTFQCGVCLCDKDRHGDTCECDGSSTNNSGLEECKNKNVNDTRYCSGKGSCDGCGKCKCKAGFSGDFCEYDDNSCKKKDNKLCSGNGMCYYGACHCSSEDWTGEDCGCSKLKHNCYAPYSNEICSGKGQCVCNECICGKLEGKTETYSGVFCEDCEECADKRCKELEEYVRCNFMSNKTICDENYNQTTNTEVQFLNKTEINAQSWPTTAKWCRAKLDEKKSIVFIHVYDKFYKKMRLIIQIEEDVEPEADIWIPVGTAIGTVILIGLMTVLTWKLLVDSMDKREYNKFMEQAKSEGYDVHNPIYQPASVNFANPMYNENTLIQNTRDHD